MPERRGYNQEEAQKEEYKKMSYYELLGVPENASTTKIKKAYKDKMTKAHTDHGGDLLYAQFLGEAWATLKDADQRAEYDAKRGTQTRYKPPKPKQPHTKYESSKKHSEPPPRREPEPEPTPDPEPQPASEEESVAPEPEANNASQAENTEISARDRQIADTRARLERKAAAGKARQEERLKRNLDRRS